jgi:hypothetical protein
MKLAQTHLYFKSARWWCDCWWLSFGTNKKCKICNLKLMTHSVCRPTSSGLLVRVCYSNKYCLAVRNRRLSYATSFKLHAVQYAEKHDKRHAGHEFDVNEQCNREWCKQRG